MFFDTAVPYQVNLQDSATYGMEMIVQLHNYVMFINVFIISVVLWFFFEIIAVTGFIQWFFYRVSFTNSSKICLSQLIFKQIRNAMLHMSTLEVVWTLLPVLALITIALPSLSMLYYFSLSFSPAVVINVIGHQWFWSYEYNYSSEQYLNSNDCAYVFCDYDNNNEDIDPLLIDQITAEFYTVEDKIMFRLIDFLMPSIHYEDYLFFNLFDFCIHINNDLMYFFDLMDALLCGRFDDMFQNEAEKIKCFANLLSLGELSQGFSGVEEAYTRAYVRFHTEFGAAFYTDGYLFDYTFDPALHELAVLLHPFLYNLEMVVLERELQMPQLLDVSSVYTGLNVLDFSQRELEKFDSIMVQVEDLNYGSYRLLEVDKPLFLPVDVPIRVIVSSDDVLHSWAVPSLGVKIDCVPGRLNVVEFRIARTGIFYGQCSEICGTQHGFMPICIVAVPRKLYNFI